MDISLPIKAAIIASLVTGLVYNYIFKPKPDNPVEQVIEAVIKDQTGITIDLTPESKDADAK